MINPLDIEQLFVIATQRENEAFEFYSAAARKVGDPSVRAMFQQLAKDEQGHFELLERFRSNPTDIMKIAPPAADWKVAESEAMPPLSTDMKPRDAIALAMKKEQQAVEFYRALGAAATTAETRHMFENLANMELGHKHRLENMFIDVGYPEVF